MDNKNDFITHFSAVDEEDRQSSAEVEDGRVEPSFGDGSASLYTKSDSDNRVAPSFGEDKTYDSSSASDEQNSINQGIDTQAISSPLNDESNNASNREFTSNLQKDENEDMKKDNKKEVPNKNNKKDSDTKGKGLKKRFVLFSLKSFAASLAIIFILFVYFDSVILSRFGVDDKWVLPAVVYSRPLELYPDQKLSLKEMEYELELLKYRKVKNPRIPGEYAVNASASRIVLIRRPFDFPDLKVRC